MSHLCVQTMSVVDPPLLYALCAGAKKDYVLAFIRLIVIIDSIFLMVGSNVSARRCLRTPFGLLDF